MISVPLGSLVRTVGLSGSLRFSRILSEAPRGLRVHWGSCGYTLTRQGVVGFIGVRVGSLGLV